MVLEIKTTSSIRSIGQYYIEVPNNDFDLVNAKLSKKWVSVDSIKKHFEGCGRDPEGSLILFLKELEEEE